MSGKPGYSYNSFANKPIKEDGKEEEKEENNFGHKIFVLIFASSYIMILN